MAFLLCPVPASFSACAHKELTETPDTETEIWEMQIKGDTEAKYSMLLKRVRIEKDVYSITGEFSGMAHDHIGGAGMVKCGLHGKIEKNNLKVHFTGHGDMAISLSLSGSFWGILSEWKGSGKWWVVHQEGCSAV